jgi:hypothetical protein
MIAEAYGNSIPLPQKNGFQKEDSVAMTKRFTNTIVLSFDFRDEEFAKEKLEESLFKQLSDSGYISFIKEKKPGFAEQITAHINVAKQPDYYLKFTGNVFEVNGEKFTEEDLIEAVKNTFPERLI